MKFTTALGLATAAVPLVAARKVNNLYADSIVKVRDVETELDERGVTIINSFQGQSRGRVVNGVAEVIVIWANPGNGRATETINQQVTVTKTVTAGSAAQVTELPGNGGTTTIEAGMTATIPAKGATHTVKVGGPGGLTYQPDQLNNVPMGDTVIFEFLSQNHTVTQSPFDTPCKKLEGGMDSGFQANPNNTVSPPPQVAMQVMSTTPLCKSPSGADSLAVHNANQGTNNRVLLPSEGTLRQGHGLLHQPHRCQDAGHVPADGRCPEWHRRGQPHHRRHRRHRRWCCRRKLWRRKWAADHCCRTSCTGHILSVWFWKQ